MASDFSTVTELPGNRASAEQLRMIHTRYRLAAEFADGKDVLEAACGPGRGLRLLASRARSVVGGDFTASLVEAAQRHYGGRPPVLRLDAQELPFSDGAFDLVLLFEALYYLPSAERFLMEARRVLRPGGILLACTPNPEWPEFNPSPFSVRYHSARELRGLLDRAGFSSEVKAGFPAAARGPAGRAVSAIRKTAVRLGLVPKTMAGKAWLKRLFYGPLGELGPELDVTVGTEPLAPTPDAPLTGFKVLYAIARRR